MFKIKADCCLVNQNKIEHDNKFLQLKYYIFPLKVNMHYHSVPWVSNSFIWCLNITVNILPKVR